VLPHSHLLEYFDAADRVVHGRILRLVNADLRVILLSTDVITKLVGNHFVEYLAESGRQARFPQCVHEAGIAVHQHDLHFVAGVLAENLRCRPRFRRVQKDMELRIAAEVFTDFPGNDGNIIGAEESKLTVVMQHAVHHVIDTAEKNRRSSRPFFENSSSETFWPGIVPG
jgi:hypothetical protein